MPRISWKCWKLIKEQNDVQVTFTSNIRITKHPRVSYTQKRVSDFIVKPSSWRSPIIIILLRVVCATTKYFFGKSQTPICFYHVCFSFIFARLEKGWNGATGEIVKDREIFMQNEILITTFSFWLLLNNILALGVFGWPQNSKYKV